MCDCDYDGPEFSETVERTARKPHKCCECHRQIESGERYTITSGVWEGEFSTFKWCGHCSAACEIKNVLTECRCFLYGGLHEDIHETARGWAKSITLYRLDIWMGRKWRVKRGPRAGQLVAVPKVPQVAS